MAYFSDSDINEAKKRVQEMKEKANKFVDSSIDQQEENYKKQEESTNEFINDSRDNQDNKSFFIILALIMLLSKEEVDNSLILALLYLLL